MDVVVLFAICMFLRFVTHAYPFSVDQLLEMKAGLSHRIKHLFHSCARDNVRSDIVLLSVTELPFSSVPGFDPQHQSRLLSRRTRNTQNSLSCYVVLSNMFIDAS